MLERRNALRKLTHLLHRGVVDHGDAEELMSLYARSFGAHGIVIGHDFGRGCAQLDIPPDWPRVHERHRFQDPSAGFLAVAPAGTSFIANRDFPDRARTELNDVFLRADFHDVMIQKFQTAWRDDIYLVAYRRRGMRAFSNDDSTLAYLLHPHVGGALATRTMLSSLARDGERGRGAADGYAYVSFPRLSVTLSARARRVWQQQLGPLSSRAWQKVERVVARAALDFQRGVSAARSRSLLPSLRVELAWVPPHVGERNRVLVLFFAEKPQERTLTAPIVELLSPMQRAVALHAATGASNTRIAALLSISLETARTHVRDVFRRLGVEGRTELAALLAADSPTRAERPRGPDGSPDD